MTAVHHRAVAWLLLALALLLPWRSGMAADDLEQGLKVAYLYNFTRFIEWPAASLGDSFDIVVIARRLDYDNDNDNDNERSPQPRLGFGFAWSATGLFIVRPQAENLHDMLIFEHLIDDSMLDVDPAGVRARQVAEQFFITRRALIRINFEQL